MRGVAAISYNIVVVLAICSSLGIQGGVGVPVYPSVSINVAGATEAKYGDFLGELRAIVTRRTRTVHGLPVLNPEASVKKVGDRFVLAHPINSNTVTLAIDVVNLYVVAFSGANNKSYFFKDFTPLQRNNLFVGTIQTSLGYSGNYIDLEKQPGVRERDFLPLRPTPLADAITRLWHGGSVAEPLLVVIQMVSEAARFKRIEEQVRKSITDRNTFTPKGLIPSMENKWSLMSSEVQRSKDGEHFIGSAPLKDDNYNPLIVEDFSTLSRYTMVAILLHQSVETTSSSYDHNEL